MAPVAHSAVWEASCAVQQRLLVAIARLASLGGSDLESGDLSRLEGLITDMERPRKCLLGPCKPDLLIAGDDTSDTSSEVSFASDDAPNLESVIGIPLARSEEEVVNTQEFRLEAAYLDCGQAPLATPLYSSDCASFAAWSLGQEAQHLATTVEVDVIIPNGHVEGVPLALEYAGCLYQVAVPVECAPGSTFRVPLLVA